VEVEPEAEPSAAAPAAAPASPVPARTIIFDDTEIADDGLEVPDFLR